jgi:hypothetical protein
MTLATTGLRAAADLLIDAAAGPLPCGPVRDILGDRDIAAAFAVQRLLTEDSLSQGRRIVGHKIGLTSPAVQRQLGVDQPDSGVLFADMRVATGATVATDKLLQPKVEARSPSSSPMTSTATYRNRESERRPASRYRPSRSSTRGCATGRSASSTPSPTTAHRHYSCWERKRWPPSISTSPHAQCGSPTTVRWSPPVAVRIAWAARSTRCAGLPAPPRRTALPSERDRSCSPPPWVRWFRCDRAARTQPRSTGSVPPRCLLPR